jgi:hypothetical protein
MYRPHPRNIGINKRTSQCQCDEFRSQQLSGIGNNGISVWHGRCKYITTLPLSYAGYLSRCGIQPGSKRNWSLANDPRPHYTHLTRVTSCEHLVQHPPPAKPHKYHATTTDFPAADALSLGASKVSLELQLCHHRKSVRRYLVARYLPRY